jgi:hypothetical protein
VRTCARLSVLLAGSTLLAACFTGQRPTLVSVPPGGNQGSSVGDDNVDAVLHLLEAPGSDAFTATYTILLKFGSALSRAVVAETAGADRSVTIDDMRVLTTAGRSQTCSLATKHCTQGVVEQQLAFVSTFAAEAPARRLRVSVRRKTGDTVSSHRRIGGFEATCVQVPVAGGREDFCALPGGHLAYQNTADAHIELTDLTPTADPELFFPPH